MDQGAAHDQLLVGPLLRYVGHNDATIWVETRNACTVDILGRSADTFEVEGHHFALVCIDGLDRSVEHPYEVRLDGVTAWPPPDYPFPQPRIRLMPDPGNLRLLFGSCRASAPHHPPYTYKGWWHPKGKGIDVLQTYGMRMLRQPSALWPDALMMMGDQLYADDVPATVAEEVAGRRVHPDGPVEVLEDFTEYCTGYRDAWTDPIVRWMLSTVPTSMMFDDHEINNEWNISRHWLEQMRATSWYEDRVLGGLMAYWVYQHLGNLSPQELAEEETYQRICQTRDGTALLRDMAEQAESDEGLSRFSYCHDFGDARLIMMDARTGRQLEPGKRQMMTDDEWEWIRDRADGDYQHLLLASSLPFLLPSGLQDTEAWAEAVGDRAWGKRMCGVAEKIRRTADMDHWAAFQRSYREFEELVIDVATGKRSEPPATVLMFGGDVHHCWVSEVSLPDDVPPARSKIWQMVCSGFRKDLRINERIPLLFGHTRVAALLGRALLATTRVGRPRLRWAPVTKPHFRNQIGTLEIAGGEVGVRMEEVTGNWRKPRLVTVIEHKLL
ncbi:alkaline phosphatase D family protein [Mycobacterium sp. IDR2000157661]|uniref:alkaline phosphatase D family protein n=1 Tax=Mycobacterium sp. IDR2000157661 TaxID=2867005 RepID=UPI001EEABF6F|nr:alkaline phosphatase D family protein [Mycobacterium sp. IDR2000157661]ULE34098.1 alkaline phosphatase family protein [Mycobacterium sp. IDR2000157661]